MAKKGKKRGSGGHPARVAAAREKERAARETAREQSDGTARLARLAQRLADEAGQLGAPLDVELWVAELIGSFWSAWAELSFDEAGAVEEPGLDFGAPLLELLARMEDDAGAAMVIKALAAVEDGELGLLARGVLEDRRLEAKLPAWSAGIGVLEITQAAVIRESVFDDAITVLLEGRHPDGESLAVSVLINHNYGGLAVDALAIESIDGVRHNLDEDDEEQVEQYVIESIDPGAAADLIDMGVSRTDETWDPPVTDEYWAGRPLALLFAGATSRPRGPEGPAEIGDEQRRELLEAFRESPESDGLALELDEVRVVMLALDYAVDFAGRDALRWSPDAVDVFMANWAPSDEGITDAALEVMPKVMDAWVRFAGARRGTPEAAIALTREVIAELAEESSVE